MDIRKMLEEKGKCCSGCGACLNSCAAGALTMQPDGRGFYYPSVQETLCVSCGRCTAVCPKLNPPETGTDEPACYALWAEDEIRDASSSGGAFTLLAEEILGRGGVVCGVVMNGEHRAVHTLVRDADGLRAMRKSKYMQSDTGFIYRDMLRELKAGKPVLFTGCPCQVAAARSYCRDYAEKLYLADIFCTGVASAQEWEEYLKSVAAPEEIAGADFRDNRYGWHCDALTLHMKDGRERHIPASEYLYGRALFSHLTTRDGCEDCEFSGLRRQGDLSIGDFWGISKYDRALNDGKGTSVVLCNTDKGRELLEAVKDRAKLLREVPLSATIGRNRLTAKAGIHPAHERFKALYPMLPFTKAAEDALENRYDIGLVSIFSCKNYGGQLTQYALKRTLNDMGYSVLMIGSVFRSRERNKGRMLFRDPPYADDEIAEVFTEEERSALNNHCRAFVVGSDQMFNHEILEVIGTTVTLDFVDGRRPKIAYAASFGHDRFGGTDGQRAYIANMFSKFDAFSVREESAVDLCKRDFGFDRAVHVLDPVFLMSMEDYNRLADKYAEEMPQEPFVFGYILNPSNKEPMLDDLAAHLQMKQRSVPDIIYKGTNNITEAYPFYTDNRAPLEKWLALFRHSGFVFTDSFHGTCMALRFHREFISFYDAHRGNARLISILKPLGLEDRIVASREELQERLGSLKPIDWEKVDAYLDAEIARCRTWLKNAIESTIHEKRALTDYDILMGKYRALLAKQEEAERRLLALEQREEERRKEHENRFSTKAKRKIRKGLKSLREHGLLYTGKKAGRFLLRRVTGSKKR